MLNRVSSLSLQQKVSITLVTVMAALSLLSYAILHEVIAPAFDKLEAQQARTNLARAEKAVRAEVSRLGGLANDYAAWDDAYHYLLNRNPTFEKSNLAIATLFDLDLDLMAYFTADGALRWGRMLIDGEDASGEIDALLADETVLRERLVMHLSPDAQVRGIVGTPYGGMIVASRAVLNTDEDGPIGGTLIMGKYLNDGLATDLRERTEVDFSWHMVTGAGTTHAAELETLLESGPDAVSQVTGNNSVDAYELIRDIRGEPLLVLHARTPRQISSLGNQTLDGAILLLAIATVIIAFVIWLLLRNMIVKPLESVASHIRQIRKSGDLSTRLTLGRTDEIGAVAESFDEMTAELDEARNSLLEQSYKAGKADTAAEVLHNIRNAMTPLINGIDRLGVVCNVTSGLKVHQATEQLADANCEAGRREKLLQYVDSAFTHIEDSHAEGAKELKAVSSQARQVEAILSDQERHSVGSRLIENLDLDEMLGEAVLVIPKRKKPAVELDLSDELGNYKVLGHRVGLLQVLGNLVLNAYESIQRSKADAGRISLSAQPETVGEKQMVRLVVSDTGCGFDSDKRNRIFQRGYSSKEGKMGGLGLHWCANALAAMGGRITAESSGDGHGAQFHVLLPQGHGG